MLRDKLIVSSSPHIASRNHVSGIMLDVVIALIPATIFGVFVFGPRAAVLVICSILAAVLSEYVYEKLTGRPVTIGDCSAVVTGLLVALNMPATAPLWLAMIGSIFAIIIVKQLFGGIGQNFMNPALAARAFMLASWPTLMTSFSAPFERLPVFGNVDIVSSATPLALLKSTEAAGNLPNYLQLFIGNVGGCIGETSALLLLIGGIYLMVRKVINPRIPLCFIGTVALLSYIFGGQNGLFTGDPLYHILAGGLMLGAFFMATDYTTSPVTPWGQVIMGIGCGVITVLIRLIGGYPEGVSYSILLMNVLSPLIDKFTVPKRYGERQKA